MPLVLDPKTLDGTTLESLRRGLRDDLKETLELVESPRGRVIDPASLDTARELVHAALAVLDRPGPDDRATLAADANLAYATMLAAIDLVKSHTDVPRVPRGRSSGSTKPA